MILFTAEEFAAKARYVVENVKTVYVLGGWGYPLRKFKTATGIADNKARALNATPYNSKWHRRPFILNATDDTFATDCVNWMEHLLWGGTFNPFDINGGAVYGSNKVPDITETQMINNYCRDISADWSKAPVGAFAWKAGHCGLVVAPGLVIESTPSTDNNGNPRRGYKDGMQYTRIGNYDVSGRTDLPVTYWEKYGLMVFLDYDNKPVKNGVIKEDGEYRLYDRGVLQTKHGEYNVGGYHWIGSDGKVAIEKEVHMPYVFSDEEPGSTGGKWTYFDGRGDMVYGFLQRGGKIYYYDPITGAMAHGEVEINARLVFDPVTGELKSVYNADAKKGEEAEEDE